MLFWTQLSDVNKVLAFHERYAGIIDSLLIPHLEILVFCERKTSFWMKNTYGMCFWRMQRLLFSKLLLFIIILFLSPEFWSEFHFLSSIYFKLSFVYVFCLFYVFSAFVYLIYFVTIVFIEVCMYFPLIEFSRLFVYLKLFKIVYGSCGNYFSRIFLVNILYTPFNLFWWCRYLKNVFLFGFVWRFSGYSLNYCQHFWSTRHFLENISNWKLLIC